MYTRSRPCGLAGVALTVPSIMWMDDVRVPEREKAMRLTRHRRPTIRAVLLAAVLAVAAMPLSPASAAPEAAPSRPGCAGPVLAGFCPPRTVALDGWRLFATRQRVRAGDPALREPLSQL